MREILLSSDEMLKVKEFSNASAKSQQQIEFGQHSTAPRSVDEISRDNMIGKIGEVAVAKMLKQDFSIHIPINFEIYERGEWDDCDIQIKAWSIDVKSTRSGQWLLIEHNKLRMRSRQRFDSLPDAIIMCKTGWDREKDEPTGVCNVVGCISLNTLLRTARRLRKGSCIPSTATILQSDNYAVRFDELNCDWDRIITYMMNSNPPQHYLIKPYM